MHIDKQLFRNYLKIKRIISAAEEACKVWCHKRNGGFKSRGWSYPDGTVCQMRKLKKSTYCIRGLCKVNTS